MLQISVTLQLAFLLGCAAAPTPSATGPQQSFRDLSPDDVAQLDKQRDLVLDVAKKRYGTNAFTKTKSDLAIIQKIVDDNVFQKNQTYELQSLGVVFGDVLATESKLHWMMVTDQWGTDPTLRFENTSIQINALTMLSKRIEDGRGVDAADLFAGVNAQVKKMIDSGQYK